MPLENIIGMSTLHERINNYLHDQTPEGPVVEAAKSDPAEYEYLLARVDINLETVQKHQEKPKRGLAEGQLSPIT